MKSLTTFLLIFNFSATLYNKEDVCFAPTGIPGNVMNGVPNLSFNFSAALTPIHGFKTILYSALGMFFIFYNPSPSPNITLALIPIDANNFLSS